MTTQTLNTQNVVRLSTQVKRAAFARREMRSQGLSVSDLADITGHCWNTINNFMQDITKNPRTETTKNIFHALGWDIAFVQRESRGTVAL